MNNVVRISPRRQKPEPLIKNTNPFLPSARTYNALRLPQGMRIHVVAGVAQTIDLAILGITIPHCKYPDRFEAGVRYGLAHNQRTDPKTQFGPLFSAGFCLAKIFYRKFAPNHRLAASGSFRGKITATEN